MIEISLAGGPFSGQKHFVDSLAEPILCSNNGLSESQYVHALGSSFSIEGGGEQTNEHAHFFHAALAAKGVEAMSRYLEVNGM